MNSTMDVSLKPSTQFKRNASIFAIVSLVFISVSYTLGFNPFTIFTEFKYVINLANDMVPPNLDVIWSTPRLFQNVYATVSMAFLGTLFGGSIALFSSFFASRVVVPVSGVCTSIRFLMVLERVTPNFIVMLMLQCIFGLGPFSGMISIAIGSFGMFGKLFADAIDHTEQGPLEGILSTGATRSQMVRYGIIPQVMPSFIANLFYAFDINMRNAIALGMFGGGGLGYELYKASKTLQYRDQLALILVIVVLIATMERLSDFLRKCIFSSTRLK